MQCLFCSRVKENKRHLSFLPINPLCRGKNVSLKKKLFHYIYSIRRNVGIQIYNFCRQCLFSFASNKKFQHSIYNFNVNNEIKYHYIDITKLPCPFLLRHIYGVTIYGVTRLARVDIGKSIHACFFCPISLYNVFCPISLHKVFCPAYGIFACKKNKCSVQFFKEVLN